MDEAQLRTISQMTALEHRFWAKVTIIDDDDSCWLWTAFRHEDSRSGGDWVDARGMFGWNHPLTSKKKSEYAPRVSFYLINGYLPECVCHTCDNPPCVRPSHLFAGTHLDNNRDRHAKGRSRGGFSSELVRGSSNTQAVLTEDQVLQIRNLSASGMTDTAIATQFGVNRASITYIVQGKTWTHVSGPIQTEKNRNSSLKRGRFTAEQTESIRSRFKAGERQKDLAAEFGVTQGAISYICRTPGYRPK
jgi:plasmid maintenance system antidote protein VapI